MNWKSTRRAPRRILSPRRSTTRSQESSPSHTSYERFEDDIFPWLGRRPIHEISPQEMLAVIQRIENRGAGDTAHRTLGSCSQVYSDGISKGVCERNICGDLRAALRQLGLIHLQAAVFLAPTAVGLLGDVGFPVCRRRRLNRTVETNPRIYVAILFMTYENPESLFTFE